MAAPMKKKSLLTNHKIFKDLQKNSLVSRTTDVSNNLISVQGDRLFIWDDYHSCFKSLRIGSYAGNSSPTRRKITTTTDGDEDNDQDSSPPSNEKDNSVGATLEESYETLLCSNPPLHPVTSVEFNLTGSLAAAIAKNCITIVEIPRPRPRKVSGSGDATAEVLCRSWILDERFFTSHTSESVLKVLWHPGSSSHLCILTTDNCLRLYNTVKPDCPQQKVQLCDSSKFMSALGDDFVSMDFGEPIRGLDADDLSWPIYLLKGTGDVHVTYSKLISSKPMKVSAALSVLSAVEDNYGTDSCDILYLGGSPSVLVIATTLGTLYHCLLLEKDYDGSRFAMNGSFSLFVYDCVKLELTLKVATQAMVSSLTNDVTTTVRLIKDPSSNNNRYHCSHSTGVHSVILPWKIKLNQYATDGDDNSMPDVGNAHDTVVAYIICTQPFLETKPAPIRGLTFFKIDIVSTLLICLMNDFSCICLTLRDPNSGEVSKLLSEKQSILSPTKSRVARKSFDEHIRNILGRSATNPLIKTPRDQDLSAEQSLKLLTRQTQVFREQYLHKLELAKDEVDRRVSLLAKLRKQQSVDLDALLEEKSQLTDCARQLAERYDDVNGNQERLLVRIEAVMTRIQASISTQSDAEVKLNSDLKGREKAIAQLRMTLEQIKRKNTYQKNLILKREMESPKRCLSDKQLKSVNTLLREESQQIENMVTQVKAMKCTGEL